MQASLSQQIVRRLRRQLMNIMALDDQQIEDSYTSLIGTGYEEEALMQLREAISAGSKFSYQKRYVQIMDRLLRFPVYNSILHNYLLELYTSVVIYLANNSHLTAVEDVKLIRKFWIGWINPLLYQHLRDNVYNATGIEIDRLKFSMVALQPLRLYYTQTLRLSHYMLSIHLPEVYPPPLDHARIEAERREKMERKSKRAQRQKRRQQMQQPQPQINQLLVKEQEQDLKRARYPSQQTQASPAQTHSQKQTHCSENISQLSKNHQHKISVHQVLQMRRKIKSLLSGECYECGLQFVLRDNLLQHQNQHFIERRKKCEKNRKNQAPQKVMKKPMLNESQWIGEDNDVKSQNFKVILSDQLCKIQCGICHEELELIFLNSHWVANQALTVSIEDQRVQIHKSCYQSLKNNSE